MVTVTLDGGPDMVTVTLDGGPDMVTVTLDGGPDMVITFRWELLVWIFQCRSLRLFFGGGTISGYW